MTRFSLISCMTLVLCAAVPVESHAQLEEGESDSSDGIFHFAPETPQQLVRAIEIADQVGRPTEAQRFIRQLVSPLPVTEELVALRREFGIGVFLDLYTRPHLQPEAKQLLDAVNEASREIIPSQLRLEQLLNDPAGNAESRSAAVLEILSARDEAVPVLLAADPDSPAGQLASSILKRNARELRRGLYAQLDNTADPTVRARILNLLSRTGDPSLADRLLRWQFGADVSPEVASAAANAVERLAAGAAVPATRAAAAERLSQNVMKHLKAASTRFGTQDIPADQSHFPDDSDRSELVTLAQSQAADLVVLTDADDRAKSLQFASQLAMPGATVSADPASAAVIDGALKVALAAQNWPAATAILELIRAEAAEGNASVPDSHLLTSALLDRDPRVRVAAAQLLLETGQTEAARGDLRRQIQAVVSGSFLPEAVVIEPRGTERIDGVTLLRGAGFDVVGAATGAEGFELAANQLQTELILVHSNCQQWPLTQLVANLRADARTKGVPIVVYGPSWSRDAVRAVARNYDGVWFIDEPVTELTLFERMSWLRVPGPLLSPEDRQRLKSMIVTSESADAQVSLR